MDAATLSRAMGGTLPIAQYAALAPAFTTALTQAGCTTVNRAAMWCAQIGHESLGLRYMEEIASGAAYEGRRDLGNTHPGDGRRFKGHGPIQVTGRANHAACSKWAHARGLVPTPTYFVDHPAELAGTQYGFIGAVWYWTTRNLNAYADRGDVLGATKIINGGTNGYPDRVARWNRCKGIGSGLLAGGITLTPVVPNVAGISAGIITTSSTTVDGQPVHLGDVINGVAGPVKWRTLTTPGRYPGAACTCITQIIPIVEALLIKRGVIKERLDFWQGSYCGGVAASAGTHNGGGVIDTKQATEAVAVAFRECGAAAWVRKPGAKYGNFTTPHVHAVIDGCPHLAAGAAKQVRDYRAGRNGLANGAADYHPRPAELRTFKQAIRALATTTKTTTRQEGVPIMAKPNKWRRAKPQKFAKSKAYHTIPLDDAHKIYSAAAGPGTIYLVADLVTDVDCWARVVTVNKNGKKVTYSTRYDRIKIKAGGDQIVWWDTIGGPAKGYKQKLVRLQLLAYSRPVTLKSARIRAGKE